MHLNVRCLILAVVFRDPVPENKELVHIYYSALNFRDVMMMTGKLAPEVITKDRREQVCMTLVFKMFCQVTYA